MLAAILAFFWALITPVQSALLAAYPNSIQKISNDTIYLVSGRKLVYDDHRRKTVSQLIQDPDIEDQFIYPYNRGSTTPRTDAGRIRNEAFLKSLYGDTKKEVAKNLRSMVWCPRLVNQSVAFNSRNGAIDSLKKVSNELDAHPEWRNYLVNIGGTFNWRYISGTKRLSPHAFGITIDLNTKYSDYWQWECRCTNEEAKVSYRNRIPMGIVEIFEKYGFIWGGRWEHYDTMHFEFRPEFFLLR